MKINVNTRKKEVIEEMLKMGVKVGEIQAIFPNINSSTIHRLGKKLGINTRISKDRSSIENRNTKAIRKLIEENIEEGIIEKTPKVDTFLSVIDELAPTPNGKTRKISTILKQIQQESNERRWQEKQVRLSSAVLVREDGDER